MRLSHRRVSAGCMLLLSLALTGCGKGNARFFQGGPPPPPSTEFLYGSTLVGVVATEQIDTTSGALSIAAQTSGSNGTSIIASSSGGFLYAVDPSAMGVDGYSVASSGAISAIGGSPFAASGAAGGLQAVAIDSTGKYLYAIGATASGGSGTGVVVAYSINTTTGALTLLSGSPFAAGKSPVALAADPKGPFLYVSDSTIGVLGFSISSSGALTPITMSPPAAGGLDMAITPNGTYLYSVDDASLVSAYSINSTTGVLKAVAGSPFSFQAGSGLVASKVIVDPLGRFVYAYNTVGNPSTIAGFTINSGTGVLTAVSGSPFTAGSVTVAVASLAIEPTGKYLYASCGGGNCGILGFSMNASTGALTQLTGSPFNSQVTIGSMTTVLIQ